MATTPEVTMSGIRGLAAARNLRITQHAHQEMVEDNVSLDALLEVIASGEVLEDYPLHKRGPCCLVSGRTQAARPVHVVCTTAQPTLIIITVYEPKPPKWLTPTARRPKS